MRLQEKHENALNCQDEASASDDFTLDGHSLVEASGENDEW
ncbi:hypothetical protein [Rubinisphaera margarita]|nr:hypothetical protein [Rubinisphaera margarita]